MSNTPSISLNEREFRNALGLFATGVVIITAEVDGEKLGATVSSFNSVSLKPPLVLFSIARSSFGLAKWKAATAFAISILDDEQMSISNRFARAQGDKWSGLDGRRAENGAPLPPGAIVHFECSPYSIYDGGDHDIFVCEVSSYRIHYTKRQPLIFYSGKYRHLNRDDTDQVPPLDNLWLHGW
jgi:flavin reductase (DIM6/NTAB) family NADH-FMN oxidoreductase RutF